MSNIEELGLDVEEESKNTGSFEPLPDGLYEVVVTESELKSNKSGAGSHIGIKMEVIGSENGDDYNGRFMFANFNIKNDNAVAERIGRAELASLCKAIGLTNPTDTEELKDKPFCVKVRLDKKDATRNAISQYMESAIEKAAPVKPAAKKEEVKPSSAAKKPWQKK